jgi:acetyl esterase/lipase
VSNGEDLFAIPASGAQRLRYGRGKSQFGDLRVPEGEGPWPIVIVLHGGYWREKYDLEYMGHVSSALAREGFATFNTEYRRVGEEGGGWPGTFRDVGNAADYVRRLAPRHNLDVARVLVLGHSAGGQLALWLAARHRIPRTSELWVADPLSIKAAIALAGVVDLRQGWLQDLSEGAVGLLMGGSPQDVPERYASGSPAELLPIGVPQVLIHGTADDDVPLVLSEEYCVRAKELGDDCRLVVMEGVCHFEPVNPGSEAWPQVFETIRSTLKTRP